MNELEKRAAYHRKRKDGLSPFCSLGEAADKSLVVFNGTNNDTLDYSNINMDDSSEIGIHCGTEKACKSLGYKFINKLRINSPKILELDFDMDGVWSSLHLINNLSKSNIFSSEELDNLRKTARSISDATDKYKLYSKLFRDFFMSHGYNVIAYPNAIEDKGTTSYIILDPAIIETSEEAMNSKANERLDEKRKKKDKSCGKLCKDAGNVEHNVNMFNHMNSPAEGPANNPVSGPFGGDVNASAGSMGESFDKPRFQVERFNWTHEEVTLTCYDTIEDKEFEKFICYGALDEDTGRRNVLAILKDDRYELPYDIKNELISTYGLDDFGYKIEESKKSCYEGLDDKFDMSMRTLL